MTRRPDPADAALSLVLFTVLAPAAAGVCLVRGVFLSFVGGRAASAPALTPVTILAFVLLGVGLAAAALHVRRPAAARHVLANLGSSWLSRELLAAFLFGAALAADVVLRLLGVTSPRLLVVVGLLVALLGLVLLFSIASLYRLRTVPAWNTWRTPAELLGTALLLGTAFFAAVWLVSVRRTSLDVPTVRRLLALLCVVGVGAGVAQLVVARGHHRLFGRGEDDATPGVFARRVQLGLAGAALLAVAAWMGTRGGAALAGACVTLFAAELLGRVLFYASYDRVGP